MLPLLTIIGATGLQGGSVLTSALKSKQYRVRAVTRNPESPAALKLASQGVEVVAGKLDDEDSLVKAFEGSTAIFAITNFFGYFPQMSAEEAISIEAKQGINLANAALKTPTLKHYIWSTLPNISKISRGKYYVPHTIGKNKIDEYIKSKEELWKKTTFLWCTFYAQNFAYPFFTPTLLKTIGKHIQLMPIPASVPIETIGDVTHNLGLFTSAILSQPSKTQQKAVLASVQSMTHGTFLQAWSEGTGKETLFLQLKDLDEYEKLFPKWGYVEGAAMLFWEEFPDKSWSDDEVGVVTKGDLGLDEKIFIGVKEVVEGMDWSRL